MDVTSEDAQKKVNFRNVFVIHGRNLKIRNAMFSFLRSLDLKPIEWEEARKATGKPSPYIGEILRAGFSMAQAFIVLFTGDDEARLIKDFQSENDAEHEKNMTPQPRMNVILEAGMALALYPERTIIVELGRIRPMSDLSGLYSVRLDNDAPSRQILVGRLQDAGCEFETFGTDWLKIGDFS